MGRTFVRQDVQIQNSDLYDDTVAAGSTMETAPVNIEQDLNNLRSQVLNVLDATKVSNWYDDVATVNSKKRGLLQLNTDLDDMEEKRVLCRNNILTDVTVGATDNWVVLSVAGSETPTLNIAFGATSLGAVCAQTATSGAGFAVNELDEITGPDALNPKNLCVVRDATTGQALQSGGQDIFGLLQVESTATDGAAFDDVSAGNRGKISFVIANGTLDDLIACPAADIQGEVINYSYVSRHTLDTLPEACFIGNAAFVDQVASTDVTLDNAIDNQVGAATQQQNIEWRIDDANTLHWQTSDGGVNLLSILPNAGGDEIEMNIDDLDINNVNTADFSNGINVDSSGTAIDIGATAGQININGAGIVQTTGANDLELRAGNEMFLDDVNQVGSTWTQTQGVKLSETTAEWDDYETTFGGEVSLLNAIVQAAGAAASVSREKAVATVTANVTADTNVTGAGTSPNLDATLCDYSALDFVNDVDVYLNGVLLRNGADATANHDVYPGDTAANGDLKFEFALKGTGTQPDQITTICWTGH